MHDVIFLVKYVYALCALGLGLWGLRFLPFGVKGFGAVGHPALVFAVAFLGVGFSLRFVFVSGSFVGFCFFHLFLFFWFCLFGLCFCLLFSWVWGLGGFAFSSFFVFFGGGCFSFLFVFLGFVFLFWASNHQKTKRRKSCMALCFSTETAKGPDPGGSPGLEPFLSARRKS